MNSSHLVPVAGRRLAVHTAGSGIPVVLVHAFPLDHAMWAAQEPLAEQLRLIAPDLQGFGASDQATPESIVAWADDVVALLDALHVSGPAVICGISMGGYVAQHVAARHPQRVAALILVATRLEADSAEARAGRADLSAKVGRLGLGILADAMVPKLLADSAEAREAPGRAALESRLHAMITSQRVETVQAALGALAARPDMTEAMRRVGAPTLLVAGAEDALTPPSCLEAAEAIMPRAKLLIVPAAGHMVPLEQPHVFNAAVLEFLRELPEDRLQAAAGA